MTSFSKIAGSYFQPKGLGWFEAAGAVKGLAIYPDKRVEEVTISSFRDGQAIVGGLIEPVTLNTGDTMYVNEEFLYAFDNDAFNSIASDVAGLGGRHDLLFSGIKGPVYIVGPLDDEGYDTDITDAARRYVQRVSREASKTSTTKRANEDDLYVGVNGIGSIEVEKAVDGSWGVWAYDEDGSFEVRFVTGLASEAEAREVAERWYDVALSHGLTGSRKKGRRTATRRTAGVSQGTAEKVLRAVEKQFAPYISAGTEGPKLMDWDSGFGTARAIVWEEGPYDWTMAFPYGDIDPEFGGTWPDVTAEMPTDVFVEPLTGYALGLYEEPGHRYSSRTANEQMGYPGAEGGERAPLEVDTEEQQEDMPNMYASRVLPVQNRVTDWRRTAQAMTTYTVEYRLNGDHLTDWDETISPDSIDTALDSIDTAAQNLTDWQPGDTLEMRIVGWDPATGWVERRRIVTL